MRKIKQTERPYILRYIRGGRCLQDSARTLDSAKALAGLRLAKKHNRGERVEVYHRGQLIFSTGAA